MDWFLYDIGLRNERVNDNLNQRGLDKDILERLFLVSTF